LVVIAIIGILIALLLPAVQAAREAARRVSCANNMKQIGVALLAYHNSRRTFPSGCELTEISRAPRTSGWHVNILPFIEQGKIEDTIGGTASGTPINTVTGIAPPVYICPSAVDTWVIYQKTQTTNYLGVTGACLISRTAGDPDTTHCGFCCTDGIFYPTSRTRIRDITDGTSNTLAVGEKTYVRRLWFDGAWWEADPDGYLCSYSAKNIRVCPINANPGVVGYYQYEPDPPPGAVFGLLFNDIMFGSNHPGGAHFVMADGSVHFLPDDIDWHVYQLMAMVADGEAFSRSW
jgi:type II secretory pathway pseudopilin PulG